MNFEAGLPQLESFSDEKRNHCILTTTLRRFSSFRKPGESEFTEYETNDNAFQNFFRPVVYANGDCIENEGYVSILFYGNLLVSYVIYFSYIEFNCTVAVIDASGNRRFPQTLAYVFDPNSPSGLENGVPKFGLGKYLKRERLCSEFSEFLPRDCLTIYTEIYYCIRVCKVDIRTFVVKETFIQDGDRHYFNLDSSFAQELCKMSDYFQCASDTPMIENKTRRMYIPPEELKAFYHMSLILMKVKEIKIGSVADVCQLYIVADKYDIQSVIATCRQLVKSFLCRVKNSKIYVHTVESIPIILELAEKYSDKPLQEMVLVYEEIKMDFETNENTYEERLKDRLHTNWHCKYEEILMNSAYFKLIRTGDTDKDPEMKFYE